MDSVNSLIQSIDYRINQAFNKKKYLTACYGKVIAINDNGTAQVSVYGDISTNNISLPYRNYLSLGAGDDVMILTTNGDYNTGRIIDKF